MTRRNARKQEWVFPFFSPDSDDRLSLNFHRFVVLYISCDTQSVGLGQYCLPKVYNGFNSVVRPLHRCTPPLTPFCFIGKSSTQNLHKVLVESELRFLTPSTMYKSYYFRITTYIMLHVTF